MLPEMLAVGHRYPQWVGQPDGVRANLEGSRIGIEVLYRSPIAAEVDPIRPGERLEVRFTPWSASLGFFTFRFASEHFVDAPFAPRVYPVGEEAPEPMGPLTFIESGQGLPLILMVADTATGELVNLRLTGLGSDLSRFFSNFVTAATPVRYPEYERTIEAAYLRHSPQQIADLAPAEGRWVLDTEASA